MKKNYSAPIIEVVELEKVDIICSSQDPNAGEWDPV